MKNHLNHTVLPALLCASVLLSGCGAENASSDSATASEKAASPVALDVVQAIQTDALFSDRDLNQSYDAAAAVTISLDGTTASCASDAVSIDGGTITILDEGVYLLSGTLIDGQVIVNADDADKVQIVLNHADITSASSAAIYCLNADKVFLTLAEGTENALSNGGSFTAIDDNNIDAVVFSETDLTLNGTGSLTVNGGTLELTCNGNGNTAIDTNGAYTNNGGSVTTNDGSESGAGGKGGSMLRGSGKSGKSGTRPDSASQTPDANASA